MHEYMKRASFELSLIDLLFWELIKVTSNIQLLLQKSSKSVDKIVIKSNLNLLSRGLVSISREMANNFF